MHLAVNIGGIPHLAKNERDTPNFLYAALEKAACAPFFKERRIKLAEPNILYRKSGICGTRRSLPVRGVLGTHSELAILNETTFDTYYW
jgi:hypothetical protein